MTRWDVLGWVVTLILVNRHPCMLGHDWDGHVERDYPVPFCRRCGKCYDIGRYISESLMGWHEDCELANRIRAMY
jgi:hypothetical protein